MEPKVNISEEFFLLLHRNDLLEVVIRKELMRQKIETIEIDLEQKKVLKQKIYDSNNLGSEEDFKKWLHNENLTEKELYNKSFQNYRISQYAEKNFINGAESRFLKRKDHIDEVTYSLIRVNDFYLAKELYLRIEENPSAFPNLSEEFSTGPEKRTNGIVGPVSLSQGHPSLTEILKRSQVGVVNQPVNVEDSWVVSRLEEYKKATFDREMQLLMARELLYESISEEANTIIQSYIVKFKLKN